MGAHSRECFHEELHKDDKMTVTFQVADREFGGSGNLDIDFFVRDLERPPPFGEAKPPATASQPLEIRDLYGVRDY